jgi:hypothetical protein
MHRLNQVLQNLKAVSESVLSESGNDAGGNALQEIA